MKNRKEWKAIGRRELESAFLSLLEDLNPLFRQLGLREGAQEEICQAVQRRCELQLKAYDGSATPLEASQARCQPNPFVVRAQAFILMVGGRR
jgi:hypothetical protein